ncbi:ABC transporter substrate-binding protein, partial [bacterium]|nr:ABC transporter substrate-binding protein [bacterium]MBU1916784.1 ABC transporter substrate-binding protein [bacterium]
MTQKKIIITLIVLTCLISIDVFASPNKIRANISSQAPVSLHPHDSGTELITNYINQIFDTLMYIDSSGNLKPGLASEWKQVDTKNYVFELRKNVKFHNGEKFNADSVVFTIQKLLDPKEKIDNRFYWGPISGVKKTDEYKVLITLSQPDSLLPYRLATAGHILPPNYHKEVGRAIFARKPIGTGPYRFVKRDSNQNIILKANPQYWNGKPDIDNVELFSSSSIDEAVDKLVEGDLDFVSMVPGHYTKELAKKKNVKTNKAIVNNSAILMLNTKKNGILRNPLVRKALRIGLNMNHIIKYGYSGNGKVTKTLTHENELFHPIQVKEYEFDLIKAKELLIKAGIEKNKEISVLAIKPLDMVGKIVFEQLKELGFSPKIYYGTAEDEKKAILY